MQVGELVYGIVTRAHPHCEPEMACVDGSGKSDGLGPLPVQGYMIKCSLGLCRKSDMWMMIEMEGWEEREREGRRDREGRGKRERGRKIGREGVRKGEKER